MRRWVQSSQRHVVSSQSLVRQHHFDSKYISGSLPQNRGFRRPETTRYGLVQVELQRVWRDGARRWETTTTETQRSRGVPPLVPPAASSASTAKPSSSTSLNNPKPLSSLTSSSTTSASVPSTSPSNPSNSDTQLSNAAPSKASATTVSVPAESKGPLLPRIWSRVKKEATHYWDGTKLLGTEIKISARLQLKILRGGKLTRREKRQLLRTTQDLLRLIPFAVFVIVPFMEFLLPVALKLFPNMLPSTFEDKFAAEEKQRKLLRVRLEMAKFLQETLRESGLKANANVIGSKEFKEFFRKVRSTGESPSTEDIINVAKLFEDDITLDNLSRPQLVSVCRYMGLNAFGTDNFLRYQIRNRMEHIRRDDALIHNEGVNALSIKELQQACQARGVRTMGVSPARLRDELERWIDLHYTHRVSGILLILSRAFDWGEGSAGGDGVIKSLESVLSSLPDNLLNEAELEVDKETASYKQKLEVLQQQEELIEDEAEQEQKEEEARRIRREAEERARAQQEEEARVVKEMLPDSELRAAEDDDARMTSEQLMELGEALSILSAKSSVLKERDELRALMEENQLSEEELSTEPSSTTTSLSKKVRAMLTKVDAQLRDYDDRVGSSLQLISCDPQGKIPVRDLQTALKMIKHKPDEEDLEGIVRKLDVDQDGYVILEHVLELVREEGLGKVIDADAKSIIGQGQELKDSKPRKEDILQE